jgi:hypothetical protein
MGSVFGPTRRVDLRLLDIPMAEEAMGGVKMELQDCAFNLVDGACGAFLGALSLEIDAD